jgi:Protein of unknown function (DUF2848)
MSVRILPLVLEVTPEDPRRHLVPIEQAIIAGWTGRDKDAVERHIRELAALGVKPPSTTPIFYRVTASRLTTDPSIEVLGEKTGGEVEVVLLNTQGRLWVGAGSDHTDREVESYSVSVSKQVCDKPVAPLFWPYDDLVRDWDRLILRSYLVEGGNRTPYQEGSVAAMRHPDELMARFSPGGLPEGSLMFCGTISVAGGVRPASRFEFELEDPQRGRKIAYGYDVISLPDAH